MEGFLRVAVGIETSPEEVEALEQVFRLAEIPAIVDGEIARFSGDSPWVMYLTAPLPWFASRFVRMPPEAPAETLGPGLASFLGQVSGSYRARDGSVVFTDESTDVQVGLTSDLPEQAFAALLRVDFERIEAERISWDDEHQAWYTLRGEPCPDK
jgi:hypothetical protein